MGKKRTKAVNPKKSAAARIGGLASSASQIRRKGQFAGPKPKQTAGPSAAATPASNMSSVWNSNDGGDD